MASFTRAARTSLRAPQSARIPDVDPLDRPLQGPEGLNGALRRRRASEPNLEEMEGRALAAAAGGPHEARSGVASVRPGEGEQGLQAWSPGLRLSLQGRQSPGAAPADPSIDAKATELVSHADPSPRVMRSPSGVLGDIAEQRAVQHPPQSGTVGPPNWQGQPSPQRGTGRTSGSHHVSFEANAQAFGGEEVARKAAMLSRPPSLRGYPESSAAPEPPPMRSPFAAVQVAPFPDD